MGCCNSLKEPFKNNCHFRHDVLHSTKILSSASSLASFTFDETFRNIAPDYCLSDRFSQLVYPLPSSRCRCQRCESQIYPRENYSPPLILHPTTISNSLSLSHHLSNPPVPIQYQVEQHTKRIKTKLNREELFEFYPRIIYIHPMTRIFPFFSFFLPFFVHAVSKKKRKKIK